MAEPQKARRPSRAATAPDFDLEALLLDLVTPIAAQRRSERPSSGDDLETSACLPASPGDLASDGTRAFGGRAHGSFVPLIDPGSRVRFSKWSEIRLAPW